LISLAEFSGPALVKHTAQILVACLLPALAAASPQSQSAGGLPHDTLAEVGSGVITATDLIERIDLMPFPGRDRASEMDSLKIRALQSIVAERLLAGEATVRGIGFDSVAKLRLDALERAFVRDELYKKEVAAGVTVSAAEIEAGMKKYATQLRIVIFRCSSEESARILSRALQHGGTNIDSLSSAGFDRRPVSRDTVTMNFGVLDESLEEPAYSLDTAHRVSSPFMSPMLGWVVLFLVDGGPNPASGAQSINDRMITVKNAVQRRKAQAKGIRYMASVLDPRRAEADRTIFALLGKSLYAIISSDSAAHRIEGRFMLTPGEVDRLEEMLRGDLFRVLVEMPGGGLTLGSAIQAFRFEPFSTPSLGRRTFAYVLNESVKRIAREEFLTREGYRKNLQASPSVKHDVASWRDNWLSHMMQADVTGGGEPTGEEEVSGLIEYARLLSPSYEVNVREIFTDSLPKADRYRLMLLAGDDMAALARSVSKRPGWAGRGGESGYFHVRSFPDLGVRALLADSGQLVGPVSLTGGYSLFRVLGKRLPKADGSVTVDSLRKALHDVIRSDNRQRSLDRFIAGLAEKFGVKMYYDRLRDLTLFGHSMFTHRYIGFGGMMNAAPLLQPEWGWVQEYLRSQNQAP
jgi:parvulin-like peptidyl-prolyl isomerase